jgi:hypothetical protein
MRVVAGLLALASGFVPFCRLATVHLGIRPWFDLQPIPALLFDNGDPNR